MTAPTSHLLDREPLRLLITSGPEGSDRHEARDVGVGCGKASIDRREASPAGAGELREVRIGDLAVTDDGIEVHRLEADVVLPEPVPFGSDDAADHLSRIGAGDSLSKEEAHQGALRDGAGRELPVGLRVPAFHGGVMHVVGDNERDEDVRVEQLDHHTRSVSFDSSSRERTSSSVTVRPTRTIGRPVSSLRSTSVVLR